MLEFRESTQITAGSQCKIPVHSLPTHLACLAREVFRYSSQPRAAAKAPGTPCRWAPGHQRGWYPEAVLLPMSPRASAGLVPRGCAPADEPRGISGLVPRGCALCRWAPGHQWGWYPEDACESTTSPQGPAPCSPGGTTADSGCARALQSAAPALTHAASARLVAAGLGRCPARRLAAQHGHPAPLAATVRQPRAKLSCHRRGRNKVEAEPRHLVSSIPPPHPPLRSVGNELRGKNSLRAPSSKSRVIARGEESAVVPEMKPSGVNRLALQRANCRTWIMEC